MTHTHLEGVSLIGNGLGAREGKTFQAFDPARGLALPEIFHTASESEVSSAAILAASASASFGSTADRAGFLRRIADGLEAIRDVLVPRVMAETALPEGRVNGELGRTCGQLHLFAHVVEEGRWVDARIETALPDRRPIPRPDIRSMLIPLGPVAVFGASNFPLAFSVAGGDTASAFAAGCPVVCVAHYAHPGTCELVGKVIREAVRDRGLPEGTFSLLQGTGQDVGVPLVKHPLIKAVGFTGSRVAGAALTGIAAARPDPIPVYAEMSSINPVVFFRGALDSRVDEIASGLAVSVGLGVGQFCTNPGLVLLEASAAADRFVEVFSAKMAEAGPGTTLHGGIARAYDHSVKEKAEVEGVLTVAKAANRPDSCEVCPWIFRTDAGTFMARKELITETFGPSTILVTFQSKDELVELIGGLEGQLTGTIHWAESDLPLDGDILMALGAKVGRLILNQFPTGVEVCHAMVHGGPSPSTSDGGRSTSVGTRAITRFARPFCFQNFIPESLPDALRDENPLGIWRMVNGENTSDSIN